MEIYRTRTQMRQSMRARASLSTSDATSNQANERDNEALAEALAYVNALGNWPKSRAFVEVTTGVDQTDYTYPAGTTAGNITGVARWEPESRVFVPLERGPIRPPLTPLSTLSGDDDEATRGKPVRYDCGSAITVWPAPDLATYTLRIDYFRADRFLDDTTEPGVDSELIILWALASIFDLQGDTDLATIQRGKFENRLRALRTWHNNQAQQGVPGYAEQVAARVLGDNRRIIRQAGY